MGSAKTVAYWTALLDAERKRADYALMVLHDDRLGDPNGERVKVVVRARETRSGLHAEATIYRPLGAWPLVVILTKTAGDTGLLTVHAWEEWGDAPTDPHETRLLKERARVAMNAAWERGRGRAETEPEDPPCIACGAPESGHDEGYPCGGGEGEADRDHE